jgi:formylglycine-generating enzyme required for sulfatase activity
MVMVYVPAGSFMMGSDPAADPDAFSNEQPQHEVELDGFWIDQTEVTNEQYNRCVAEGDCDRSEFEDNAEFNSDDQPVVGVSWFDAESYCEWAGGQLPTEAQWEYAARGEEGHLYPWGDEFDCSIVNIRSCGDFRFTSPVGTYPDGASWVKAFDLAGNVWEWTADWYDEDYYGDSPSSNPDGLPSGNLKVLRGGSWFINAADARSANRNADFPDVRSLSKGFRCAAPG